MIDHNKPILVFQTDFTYKEGAVSSMYGVVKSVDRTLEIIDGTHELPQYDIWSASYRLNQSLRFWPEGTVYVSVVDPGVGTQRRACVAKVEGGYYVVTPDNGTLTHIARDMGILAVRQIDESVNRLRGKNTEGVAIFHGRDLFGYTAARLASGVIDFEGVGPAYPVEEIVTLNLPEAKIENGKVTGMIEIDDPNFGNAWTNIPLSLMEKAGFSYGEKLPVVIRCKDREVFSQTILFDKAFGCVGKGEPILYNNELMNVAFAVCMGSFTQTYGVSYGSTWSVTIG
ncbi:MAG: SAM-dependent chlorinase/fluorinase [Lachnospiraceae bacterium]|nr:SAM-dependent chlorinase/fluorinase [Lachnospiraceae bacterium]